MTDLRLRKRTTANLPNIIWTFLYKFFSKKHCHQNYSFFSSKCFCRFYSLTWVSLPESWRFKEACCISSHFLGFLYFEKPIFEFNFSNYCSIFFITSWFLSLLKCSSKRIFCFAVLSFISKGMFNVHKVWVTDNYNETGNIQGSNDWQFHIPLLDIF